MYKAPPAGISISTQHKHTARSPPEEMENSDGAVDVDMKAHELDRQYSLPPPPGDIGWGWRLATC